VHFLGDRSPNDGYSIKFSSAGLQATTENWQEFENMPRHYAFSPIENISPKHEIDIQEKMT